jgi:hypothetical protein
VLDLFAETLDIIQVLLQELEDQRIKRNSILKLVKDNATLEIQESCNVPREVASTKVIYLLKLTLDVLEYSPIQMVN